MGRGEALFFGGHIVVHPALVDADRLDHADGWAGEIGNMERRWEVFRGVAEECRTKILDGVAANSDRLSGHLSNKLAYCPS